MLDAQQVLSEYLHSPRRHFELNINVPTFSVFFDPLHEFVEWMKEFCGDKTIVDCGCGCGQTVAVLRHAGLEAIGIDLYGADRPLIHDIHLMNAVHFPFSPETVALICRPCRGDWIHATICKAVESGSKCVYVGKESHYEEDLEPLPYKVEKVLSSAGMQNETVWVISKEE